MNAQIELIPGTNRDTERSQYFTPPALAARVVEWAIEPSMMFEPRWLRDREGRALRVLEPSAGNGALVRPLVAAGAEVMAIEIDNRYTPDIYACKPKWVVTPCDFLKLDYCLRGNSPEFDLCVMNPPYEHGQDVAFVLHALRFAPRVVGIFRSQILHGKARKAELWSKVRPTRIAYLSERPDFGGDYGAMTDFVVLELVQRSKPGVPPIGPTAVDSEWW